MSRAPEAVRSRRTAGAVVAVTGAAGPLGRAVTARLAGQDEVRRVIAVDAAGADGLAGDGRLDGVAWRRTAVDTPAVAAALAGADAVVHCAVPLALDAAPTGAEVLRSTQSVVTAAAATGVRRVVLVTSAGVYGAAADNPLPLPEDAELAAVPDATLVRDHLEVEALAVRAAAAYRGLGVTVVRPAALVGPGVDTVVTRHFEAPRLVVVRGARPRWQFCHVDDLAAALVPAALGAVEGPLTVGCDGWLEQAEVEAISGLRHVELPATVAAGAAQRLHRLGLAPATAADLDYLVHPWVVPSTRLRAAGWRPTYDNATALGVLLDQVRGHHALAARRLGRRDASIGAAGTAGAAVAVVGTAALVRRARRRRG